MNREFVKIDFMKDSFVDRHNLYHLTTKTGTQLTNVLFFIGRKKSYIAEFE